MYVAYYMCVIVIIFVLNYLTKTPAEFRTLWYGTVLHDMVVSMKWERM